MVEIVEIDGSGRIYLPTSVRRLLQWKRFAVYVEGERIVLVPVKPVIERYYGIAKPSVYRTAREIDEAVERETKRVLEEDLR
ncbi:MAG: hypothetical protein QXY49_00650 [Thermofilaceae archaeon]